MFDELPVARGSARASHPDRIDRSGRDAGLSELPVLREIPGT